MPALRSPRRTTLVLLGILVPVGLAALVGMLLTWPGEARTTHGSVVDVEVEHPTATVASAVTAQCEGTVEDIRPGGSVPASVSCLKVRATVASGPERGAEIEVWAAATLTPDDVPAGTRIVVQRYPGADGEPDVWAWHDFERALPLMTLALVFALVTVLVAGMRGLRAIVGLALGFAVLGAYVLPALLAGSDALVVGLCGSGVIMYVVLYLAHGFSERTSTALLGTVIGLLVTAGLGIVGARWAHLSGVISEDTYQLAGLLGDQGASALRGVFLCGVVLAGLGVLNDVTITQASAVWELRATMPDASRQELFRRGMRIGRDHIASTVYTIAFAYAGAALPVLLLVQVYQLSLGQTLTSGSFAEEIVRTLVGSIGLVLAIPLTTAVAALVVSASPVDVAEDAGRRLRRRAGGHSHGHIHSGHGHGHGGLGH
ncbi:YibE/F family protein [Cellulomonas timonensis]|uniref:YibE/F family protein n=1 Tax=Cellulomonas timonensis TaxID=1689271 RepID=UPI000A43CE59|nr:YibE/F family protein [Cellulomonas timonensis]